MKTEEWKNSILDMRKQADRLAEEIIKEAKKTSQTQAELSFRTTILLGDCCRKNELLQDFVDCPMLEENYISSLIKKKLGEERIADNH